MDAIDTQDIDDEGETSEAPPRRRPMSPLRVAAFVGAVYVVALAVLVGWLGFRTYQSHQAQQQRELFLQVGRQAALNVTTIDWEHADADVQRVLDSATAAGSTRLANAADRAEGRRGGQGIQRRLRALTHCHEPQ